VSADPLDVEERVAALDLPGSGSVLEARRSLIARMYRRSRKDSVRD